MNTVTVFNTTTQAFDFSVNGGAQMNVAGLTSSIPGSASFFFQAGGSPPPGMFDYGANSCALILAPGQPTTKLSVTIPQILLAQAPLMLYFFYAADGTLSWLILADGMFLANSLGAFPS